MKTDDFSQLGALMKTSGRQPKDTAKPRAMSPDLSLKSKAKPQGSQQFPTNSPNDLKMSKTKSVANPEKAELLVLRRTITVQCWNVKATIAKSQKRDDLLPVLLRAKENNGTCGKDIAAHLLGNELGRELVSIRLLKLCESLKLLENRGEKNRTRYYLTEEGEQALESNEIMVPEESTWTIWASDDPLLDYPILWVEPFEESTAYDEIHGVDKKNTDSRKEEFKNLPRWFDDILGKVAIPGAIGSELIRLDSIENRVEAVSSNADLTLEWEPDGSSLKLGGSIGDRKVRSTPNSPTVMFESVWQELLENENLWQQWDETNHRLLVAFDSTDDRERSSLSRYLEFKRPKLRDFRQFDDTSRTIDIYPASPMDAQDWSRWKLMDLIATFATQAEFAQWQQQARDLFPEYVREFELPSRSELAQAAWDNRDEQRNSETKWHLMSVEDWRI